MQGWKIILLSSRGAPCWFDFTLCWNWSWNSRGVLLDFKAQVEKVEEGSWLYYCGSNATDAPQSLSSLHHLQQRSHKSAKWVSVYPRALLQVVLPSFCSRKQRHDHNSLCLNPQGFRYHYNEKPQPPELTRRSGGQGQKTLRVSGVPGISWILQHQVHTYRNNNGEVITAAMAALSDTLEGRPGSHAGPAILH